MDREAQTKNPKTKRYGVWQEETARHGRCWRYNVRVQNSDGKLCRRTGSGFATKAECETAVAALRLAARENKYGLVRTPTRRTLNVHQAIEGYINSLVASWTAKHGSEYAGRSIRQLYHVRGWVQFIGASKSVIDVNKADLVLWAERELTRGVKASSVQRRLNNIRAALYHAKESHPELSAFTVPKYSLGTEALLGRVRILDEEEIRMISQMLQSNNEWRDAYDFFRIALGSGGRFDELVPVVLRKDMATAGIKWTDININAGTVKLFSGKTGKGRTIYVPAVVDVLVERKKANLGNRVHAFVCRDHWIRKIFRQVSKLCTIPYGQQIAGGWTVHDLRHTCLTHLLQNGVDLAAVRDFAGHSSISETSKYVHSTEKAKNLLAKASSGLIDFTV